MLNRLTKNKRGQIPIISDIGNFIGSSIQWLTNSAPKPFLIIFFLLLLAIGGLLLTFTVRMLGYHCLAPTTPGGVSIPYTVPLINIAANWDLTTNSPTQEELLAPGGIDVSALSACSFTRNPGQATFNNQTFTGWIYEPTPGCAICPSGIGYWVGQGAFLQAEVATEACAGDVYRQPTNNISWKCGVFTCQPPIGYYWRQSDNKYVCNDATLCGITSTGAQAWNQRIIEAGGTPLYPTGNTYGTSSDDVFSIQCTQDLKAQFTIWHVPIFDYRIWLFAIILMLLFTFLNFVLTHKR